MPMNAKKCDVPSTYHQCVKYPLRGAQGMIPVDDDPFLEVEAYYANANFIEWEEIKRKERERLKLKPRQLRPNLLQITKLVIHLDCGAVKTYRRFKAPTRGKTKVPIIFNASSNMKSCQKDRDPITSLEARCQLFQPKIRSMYLRAWPWRIKNRGKVPPFEAMLSP